MFQQRTCSICNRSFRIDEDVDVGGFVIAYAHTDLLPVGAKLEDGRFVCSECVITHKLPEDVVGAMTLKTEEALQERVKKCSLYRYAEEELKRAGLFDKDADYNGEIAPFVLRMVGEWAKFEHSGESHSLALLLFSRVINYQPLTPLTDDPEEWNQVSDDLWQSKRHANSFSQDGGKTYYNVDDPERRMNKADEKEGK